MASFVYTPFKEALLQGLVDLSAVDVVAILIDEADYTPSAVHDFLDDVAVGARIAVSDPLTGKTFTGGVFDASNPVLPSVSGDAGESVLIAVDTGSDATSRLISYHDGLTFTPTGTNITIQFNASGIFAI